MLNGQFAVFAACIVLGSSLSLAPVFANEEKVPWATMGQPSDQKPQELNGVGIDEKLGQAVDTTLSFVDDKGQNVTIGQYFTKGKPVILSLVYFNCPSLCNLHLNGLNDAFKQLDWPVGDKFEVVSVSINPQEKFELASDKKAAYLKEYGRENVAHGWHFLTGTEDQIQKLAKSVGFNYKYDEKSKEYLHTAAAIVITPDGKISRYLHGVFFEPKTLRLSLVEASNGKIGEFVDNFMLFCFKYDPNKRTYAFYAYNIMKFGAGLTVLAMFAFFFNAWRRMSAESKES